MGSGPQNMPVTNQPMPLRGSSSGQPSNGVNQLNGGQPSRKRCYCCCCIPIVCPCCECQCDPCNCDLMPCPDCCD